MKNSAKAGVPLMELLIAIGIFAYAGILIVRIFLTASFMENYAMDSNSAVMKTQSVIEVIKSLKDYNENIYAQLGFVKKENSNDFEKFYDKNWNLTHNDAVFAMKVTFSKENTDAGIMLSQHIVVRRCKSYPFLRESRDVLADIRSKQYFAS